MADTATTFAGIHNENEFYSHHYLNASYTCFGTHVTGIRWLKSRFVRKALGVWTGVTGVVNNERVGHG